MEVKEKGKAGRPRKEIDWSLFEQLCQIQCTQSEIASMLKIDRDTLRDRVLDHFKEDYSSIYNKFTEAGKCSLRRMQFVLAKKNAGMAIWLGKQYLGQRDKELDEHAEKKLANDISTFVQGMKAAGEARKE